MHRVAAIVLFLSFCSCGSIEDREAPPPARGKVGAPSREEKPTGPGAVEGRGRIERIKGSPSAGYLELYESNLYLSPGGPAPIGPHRRLGAPPGQPPRHDGYYRIDGLPPGRYSVLVSQPVFFIRPKVIPDVEIRSGETLALNVDLPIEYSCIFRDDKQWTGAGNAWYQTFVATGTSVSGVSFVVAGHGCENVEVSILRDNGKSDVREWAEVGKHTVAEIGVCTDNWTKWRSGEVPLTPGTRYAVRLVGKGGDGNLQPYMRVRDDKSYKKGRAYDAEGKELKFDLNITVFADTDDTRITVCRRTPGVGILKDGYFSMKWGHTFVAKHSSLAAVDVWAAGAGGRWDITFRWRIREGGPEGKQIGPVKVTRAGSQAAGCGLHGVSYRPGEVPLKAGKTYFVEWEAVDPPAESPGFNPYLSDDPYEEGNGWQWLKGEWVERPDDDVSMTVIEYR